MTDATSRMFPPTLAELEIQAEAAANPAAWDYLAHGSGDESTMRDNVTAWTRWKLRPQVLRDMGDVRTSTTVLGIDVDAPILIAPTAMHRFVCDDGERATSPAPRRAPKRSTSSRWLRRPRSRRLRPRHPTARDGRRCTCCATAAAPARSPSTPARPGYRAVVASVDGAAVPRRSRLAGGALVPPDTFRFPNLASPDDPHNTNLMAMVSDFDPTVTFDDLALFGEWSGLPIVVKGVMRGDDAAKCVDAGAAAIAVSNHGGRTLDGVAATADVLPDIVEAVGGRAEVYVDGGIRSGIDVLRAVALGAQAVMIGRPVLWGLAVDGADGAVAVLHHLAEELGRAMALCGRDRVDLLTRDLLLGAT